MMSSPGQGTHRTRLLEAARSLLRERDYGAITARDLVAASNTNLGSIGYHFGSKEALLNEAIGLALEECCAAIVHSTSADIRTGPDALLSLLRMLLDEFDSMRPYYQAFIEALARSARTPELRQQLASHYNRQRDRVHRWFTNSLGGVIGPDQASCLASVMIATADGLLIQRFVDPDNTPGSTEVANAYINVLAAAGYHGSQQ